ncbi:glycoside hydrolase family 73 protein [Fructobacillus cardui]|uniref:glycoside hydrolase family 73 protein n=1 Tax=Fructobacillus cardui TaxID=2893170 RepID=UPI003BA8D525
MVAKKRKKKKWFFLPKAKKKRRIYFILLLVFLTLIALTVAMNQSMTTKKDQIIYQDEAKQKQLQIWAPFAQKMQYKYRIFASISLAQAILESDWNQSSLSKDYNNLYGIKASASQAGVVVPTKEYEDGHWITVDQKFASYNTWQESMEAHAQLISKGTHWNPNQYEHVLAAKNYQAAAQALVQDGYATDPTYAAKLVAVIETWNLKRFDLAVKMGDATS